MTLAHWRTAAGPWAHFLKPSLMAVAAPGGEVAGLFNADVDRWRPQASDTAVIVDLPALEAISIGVALGRLDWCVVPMFNTVHASSAEVLRTRELVQALADAAAELPKHPLGPPVFLLDSARQVKLNDGDFDNRWYVFASDFPSASFFLLHGIRRLAVLAHEVQLDLRDALAAHGALDPAVVNPGDGARAPFPAPRAAIVRGVAKLGRALVQTDDRTFGRPLSHG